MRDQLLPGLMYSDPSGAELPLALARLDRLDPRQAYRKGNVRLLLGGLNMLRNSLADDKLLFAYLTRLASTFNHDIIQHLGPHVDVPGMRRTRKVRGDAVDDSNDLGLDEELEDPKGRELDPGHEDVLSCRVSL